MADGIRPRFQIEFHSRWRNGAPVMPQIKRVTFDGRPMVLIDPEDRDQVERLHDSIFRYGNGVVDRDGLGYDDTQATLRELADPKPARIDEPGPWGIVEAACVHDDTRRTWITPALGYWYPIGADTPENSDDWDSLIDPVLIREGVAS